MHEDNTAAIAAALAAIPQHKPIPRAFFVPGVYVFKAGGFVKIGLAKNVQKRAMGVQTGCPLPIRIMFFMRHEEAQFIEKRANKILIDRHQHVEWFRVTSRYAVQVITQAKEEIEAAKRENITPLQPALSKQEKRKHRNLRGQRTNYAQYGLRTPTGRVR